MGADDLDDDFENSEDLTEPTSLQKNLPQVALYSATGLSVLLFLGTFVWLQFPSAAIDAELRAMRPHLTKKVPPLRRSARGKVGDKVEKGGSERAGKPRSPVAPKRKSAVLHPHPDPKLVERTDIGLLPIVGADGRRPWRVYSRPFNVLEKRPRISVVMTGLGVSFAATESVVGVLPGEVTLAFAPYARKLKDWIDAARGAGHEVLINLPMEPRDYPRSDPGPFGLLTGLDADQNKRRLDWVLSRMTGYVGVSNYMGDRFTNNQSAMRPILGEMERRGLMFLDSMGSAVSVGPKMAKALKLPFSMNDRVIDQIVSRRAIDKELAEIERIAKARGSAVALAHPYPVTIRRLQRWIADLDEKGLVLAPITAVVAKRKK
jgi:hypothetical protein